MEQNLTYHCPVCGGVIEKSPYTDCRDAIYTSCDNCGVFAMSREFCDDFLQKETDRKRTATFLAAHKEDKLRPFLTNGAVMPPEGYQCYPYYRLSSATKKPNP